MSGESIKIGVRVRPFNATEISQNQMLCVDMTDTQVILKDLIEGRPERKYAFDHAMWSFDGFKNDDKGYSHPTGDKYVDQNKVWDMLGTTVLAKAWGGLNCTLFAYGQTGSGKSYSQFGYGANRGIIPRCADELFKRIESNKDTDLSFQVTVRIIEIYMERLQDLLVDTGRKGKKELDIRQIAGKITIPDATTEPVSNYKQIQDLIDKGDKNRTVGSTNMNATSSRAHTVVTIIFKKITKNADKSKPPLVMESEINLVDLAGSEKSDQAGTSGDRLKEGNAINQSLTSLGNVISTLADVALGKKPKNAHIPYRDSNLTRMLQQALGGNSSTIMICAIRPGHLYYEETLNTLRYADRAKKIKNKPVINESPQDKIIRELQEENKRLKEEMMKGGGGVGLGGGSDPEAAEKLRKAQEEMERNQRQLEEMEKSWEQKLAEAEDRNNEEERAKAEEQEARNSGRPQLLNLNEDGMLDRKIFFDLSKITKATVGRKQHGDEAAQPTLVLGGIGIQDQHAVFETTSSGTTLRPLGDSAVDYIWINGVKITGTKPVKLVANDRIIFGTGSCFLFRNQDKASEAKIQDTKENPITIEMAMKEKLDNEDKAAAAEAAEQKAQQEAEMAKKMKELHDKMEAERKAQEAEQDKMRLEFEAKILAMNAEIANKKDDEEAQKEALEREAKMRLEMEFKIEQDKIKAQKEETERLERIRKEEAAIKNRQAEFSALEKKLGLVLPLINEANLIASELKRDIKFNVKMTRVMPDFGALMESRTDIFVKIDNKEDNYYYVWDADKFQNRLYMMRDHLNEYFDKDTIPDYSDKDKDPFWDPPEPQLIGTSYLALKNLGYMLENELHARILSNEGVQGFNGMLNLKYWPCAKDGVSEPEDDVLCDEPEELVGKEVFFRVEIADAQDLPKDLCKNVFVTYQFKHEPGVIYSTGEMEGYNQAPKFNYQHVHHIDLVTDYIIDYITSGNIVFKTFAYPQFQIKDKKQQGKIDRSKPRQQAQVVVQNNTPRSGRGNTSQPLPKTQQYSNQNQQQVNYVKKTNTVEKSNGSSCCTIF